MARPSKLNEELINELADNLRIGLPLVSACDLLGITTMSCSNWMRQGESDYDNEIESLYSLFFYTIKKAKAEFERDALLDIGSGRPGWQGKAWILERVNQKYMPKQEITAGDDGKVTVVLGGKVKSVRNSTADDNSN